MEKFKEVFLSTFKKMVDFLSILALILTVLSGSMALFYDELAVLFETLNWPQERLVWLTISLGGLGSAGVILTRVSSGLKAALLVAKSNQEISQQSFQREMQARLDNQERLYEARIESIKQESMAETKLLKSQLEVYTKELKKQNQFNEIQAQKYASAPDRLVDPKLKEKYQDFLKNKKGE